MALIDLIKNAPYRTPLTDSNNIMSKQWVNWFTKAFQAILENLEIDIADLNIETSIETAFNSNIASELSALAINSIEQAGVNLDNILDIINTLFVNNVQKLTDDECIEPIIDNNSQQIQDLTNNVGILSTTTAITNITVDTALDNTYHRVLVDSSGSAITITLPDCTACEGKEFIVYGFAGLNVITVDTVSSQQIKRIITDIATSDVVALGSVVYYVSQGTYWVANN